MQMATWTWLWSTKVVTLFLFYWAMGMARLPLLQVQQRGSRPTSVAIADFNNDGRLDLAVSNQAENTVLILLGNGDATFTAHSTSSTGGGPVAETLGDFNGDGKLDLAVV